MDELKNALINVLNQSLLPLDCKVYVIRDLHHDLETLYAQKLKEVAEVDNAEIKGQSDTERGNAEA